MRARCSARRAVHLVLVAMVIVVGLVTGVKALLDRGQQTRRATLQPTDMTLMWGGWVVTGVGARMDKVEKLCVITDWQQAPPGPTVGLATPKDIECVWRLRAR